jgi:DNA-binding CsgD family transcriptional regulator
MKLPLPGQRFPLAIRVAPVPGVKMPLFGYSRTALVCVTDLETEIRSPETELRSLFGLTYAEARVATAIFDGLSMREAAETLGVALNTVRFQLALVYEKSGVTRQAELVKMMMRLSSGPGQS